MMEGKSKRQLFHLAKLTLRSICFTPVIAGMDGFVGKPFKIAEIIDKMNELAWKKEVDP